MLYFNKCQELINWSVNYLTILQGALVKSACRLSQTPPPPPVTSPPPPTSFDASYEWDASLLQVTHNTLSDFLVGLPAINTGWRRVL